MTRQYEATSFGLMAGNRLPVQRCDLDLVWRVVNTDNFGSDYPNEKWASDPMNEKDAKAEAARLNAQISDYSSRYHKAVRMPYKLQPGFEP